MPRKAGVYVIECPHCGCVTVIDGPGCKCGTCGHKVTKKELDSILIRRGEARRERLRRKSK